MRKLTLDEFIIKAQQIHGNKFDYSKSIYVNRSVDIEIICPFHGSFYQRPNNHLVKKHGCNLCSPTRGAKLTRQQFLDKCNRIHKNKYDYSKTIFRGVKRIITIICPLHGEFEQIAGSHFLGGCRVCANNKPLTLFEFLLRAKQIHQNKFDYSLVKLEDFKDKIIIICPKHNKFQQSVNGHLSGRGCKLCASNNKSKKESLWLDIHNVPNDSLYRNVRININGRKFYVDGFFKREKVIYEFLGDYWHGNPAVFSPTDINKNNKKTFQELFNSTVEKIRFLRKNGFKVITIWENRFDHEYYDNRREPR